MSSPAESAAPSAAARSAICTSRSPGRRCCAAYRSPWAPARCTRSWGRTARARARWHTCWRAGQATRSFRAACSFEGQDLLALAPEQRARAGLFLGFQYPVEIPGVNNAYLLKAAVNAARRERGLAELDAFEFLALVRAKIKLMQIDESFLSRGVNEGFSGGEKKRNEILQMLVLEPKLALLDETDSGLDIDALKIVANGINSLRAAERAIVLVTHYQRTARLRRARLRARAGARPHRAQRRSHAGARARAARL